MNYRASLIPGMPMETLLSNQGLQGQAIPNQPFQNQAMTGGMAQGMRPAPKAVLLKALNEYSFAMDEAALFLDTHPDNQEALSYFKNAVNMRKAAMNAYEQQYGPLFSENVTVDRWNWVTETWPWEGEE